MKLLFNFILLLLLGAACLPPQPAYADEDHSESHDVLGFDLSRGWSEPYLHSHFSPLGTPLVHSFRTEPAFTQRDFFVDYGFRNEANADEQEVEAELEWAISRRFGLILEVPYISVDDEDDGSAYGFGNLAISPRLLLAEYDRFLLAFNLEIETTTGDTNGGISHDEPALAPSFSTWIDLGNWWTVNAQSGVEFPLETGDSELFIRTALLHTFAPAEVHDHDRALDSHPHEHLPDLFTIIFEADFSLGLSGAEDGNWTAEGVIGLDAGIRKDTNMRVGYQFPLSTHQELNSGIIFGLIYHF